MSQLLNQLKQAFPSLDFQADVALAAYTQVKLGGPAEVFIAVTDRLYLEQLSQYCFLNQVPLTILGWGANTLIADRGLRGLVILNQTKQVEIVSPELVHKTRSNDQSQVAPTPRFTELLENSSQSTSKSSNLPTFADLEYDESDKPQQKLLADSGAPLPWLINHALQLGLTGLQWYARIPATLGGAVVNNIHGGSHFLSEVILGVDVVTPDGKIEHWPTSQLDFGYDYSVFHKIPAVITRVHLSLFQGDVVRAQSVVQHWATAKRHQPQRSLGCIFQNLSSADQSRLNLPTPSVGYFIENILKLKGFQIGGASISQQHAAFIESKMDCTAEDYRTLIAHITQAAKQHNLKLQPEIFFRGFTQNELSGIIDEQRSLV